MIQFYAIGAGALAALLAVWALVRKLTGVGQTAGLAQGESRVIDDANKVTASAASAADVGRQQLATEKQDNAQASDDSAARVLAADGLQDGAAAVNDAIGRTNARDRAAR